jgi:hypothetical protein
VPLGRATFIPSAALEFGAKHNYSLNETEQFNLKVMWLTYLEHTHFKSWTGHQLALLRFSLLFLLLFVVIPGQYFEMGHN